MNFSLPEALRGIAEQRAVQTGFPTADEYVADLIRRDVAQHQAPDYYLRQALAGSGDPADVTEEALAKRKKEIEALLIQGLESGPATPMTAENWAALRQRVQEKLGKRSTKSGH